VSGFTPSHALRSCYASVKRMLRLESCCRDGRKAGVIEGRELGLQKGWEIGQEVGFYAGCVQVRECVATLSG